QMDRRAETEPPALWCYTNQPAFSCTPPNLSWLSLLLNLHPTGQCLVDDRSDLDHVLAAGVGVFRELLDHRFVLRAGGREDIEVRQDLRAVDAHVKRPGTSG